MQILNTLRKQIMASYRLPAEVGSDTRQENISMKATLIHRFFGKKSNKAVQSVQNKKIVRWSDQNSKKKYFFLRRWSDTIGFKLSDTISYTQKNGTQSQEKDRLIKESVLKKGRYNRKTESVLEYRSIGPFAHHFSNTDLQDVTNLAERCEGGVGVELRMRTNIPSNK